MPYTRGEIDALILDYTERVEALRACQDALHHLQSRRTVFKATARANRRLLAEVGRLNEAKISAQALLAEHGLLGVRPLMNPSLN